MRTKKGLELSINFLVVLIIAIVVLAFGIKFAMDLMGSSEQLHNQVSKETERQILQLLTPKDRVSIPLHTQTIKPGKFLVFGLGILNIDSGPFFKVGMDGGTATDKDNNVIENFIWANHSVLPPPNPVKINNKDKETFGIGVKVPPGSPKGTYVLNVYVCHGETAADVPTCDDTSSNLYWERPLKIYVNVP